MTNIKRVHVLYIALAVGVLMAVVYYVNQSGDHRPPPSAKGYNEGVQMGKHSPGAG